MKAIISSEWKGEDVFVIGGGASLLSFDFGWFIGRRTIGVNEAFRKGPSICPAMIFSDAKWWSNNKWALETYAQAGGRVFSACPDQGRLKLDWLMAVERIKSGAPTGGDVIGWNYSTGATAIHLALLLGAANVYLFGFDMAPVGTRTHWHNAYQKATIPSTFSRHLDGMKTLAAAVKVHYPDASIWNVTDGTSRLDCWPKISMVELESKLAAPAPVLPEPRARSRRKTSVTYL